ncbi:hypothetical protein BCEN4_800048 [Burkholderia cenocepacia]|uniref:hypothetical protein n=1 Tax=Burkholderia cenocepacia TaxID=95486 RepID=UPI00192B2B39|nr:hypothetical protein [Burkholderia cenocepacia]CAD9228383.1 hypothetical protein BCEN4_800048 [Burkholderia cenocepacia]
MGGSKNLEEIQAPGPTPFDIGHIAFYDGVTFEANPFAWLSDEWHAWRSGWINAEAGFNEGEAF